MKSIRLIALCVLTAAVCTSCGKDDQPQDYRSFVGTWGVEKIHYKTYNTDFDGNPITGSMEESIYEYDPYDLDNGIHMVFKEDQTCVIRDSDIDSLFNPVDSTYIHCPDTTLVYKYDYSYDSKRAILYMTANNITSSMLHITSITENSFEYENTYDQDEDNRVYVEIAHLKRIGDAKAKPTARKSNPLRQHWPGSLLNRR